MIKAPTIKRISEKAGVAASTVADVLRNRPGYKPETREKILKVAREIRYRPNRLSIALSGGRTMTIGLLGGNLEIASAYSKIASIETVARSRGYHVYFVNTAWQGDDNFSSDVQHVQDLLARKVDGVIIGYAGDVNPPEQVIEILCAQQIPLVTLDCSVPKILHQVVVNRATGICEAVSHLAELGHRHVALITNQWALDHPGAKVRNYLDGFRRAGIRVSAGPPWTIDPVGNTELQTSNVVKTCFMKKTDLPTAIVLFDDACAMAAIKGLNEVGLHVPQDVSVVGFVDANFASFVTPSLTTIRQPREEVGQAACQMLLDVLENPEAESAVIEFPCSLVVRESTGPCSRSIH